jgi:polar amino acid transport system substrate-binding protein
MNAPLLHSTLRLPLFLVVLAAFALSPAHAAPVQPSLQATMQTPLQVVTEELPPYNMTVDGRLTGMSTEVVEAALKEAGLSAPIQSMPWARAYDLALHDDNVLIYSIARIPEREALFQWVGAIAPTTWYMYSYGERPIQLNSLEGAKAYQNGVVKEDVGELYLIARGFSNGLNLQSSNRRELNYEKLKTGHIDLWIANELNAVWLARQAGDDPARTLVRSLALPDLGGTDGLYMAFSLKTSASIVARLRQALQRIHDNGTYAAIARKWM